MYLRNVVTTFDAPKKRGNCICTAANVNSCQLTFKIVQNLKENYVTAKHATQEAITGGN
jgi:hypothetical protein